MKNLVIFTIFLYISLTHFTFSQKINLEFDNGSRQLFDNYKDLLFKIDDSIKVLKKNGFKKTICKIVKRKLNKRKLIYFSVDRDTWLSR